MSLLNPAGLLILFAIIIPIIVHLIQRKKRKQYYLGSISWLTDLEKPRQSNTQLEKLLLLLLRLLMISALAMLMAKPFFTVDSKKTESRWVIADTFSANEINNLIEKINTMNTEDSDFNSVYLGNCSLNIPLSESDIEAKKQEACLSELINNRIAHATNLISQSENTTIYWLVKDSTYRHYALSRPFSFLDNGIWKTTMQINSQFRVNGKQSFDGVESDSIQRISTSLEANILSDKLSLTAILLSDDQSFLRKVREDYERIIEPLSQSFQFNVQLRESGARTSSPYNDIIISITDSKKLAVEEGDLVFIAKHSESNEKSIWLLKSQVKGQSSGVAEKCLVEGFTESDCYVLYFTGDRDDRGVNDIARENDTAKYGFKHATSPDYLIYALQAIMTHPTSYIEFSGKKDDLNEERSSVERNVLHWILLAIIILFISERWLATFLRRKERGLNE